MRRETGEVDATAPTGTIEALRAAGARFAFLHGSRVDGRPRPESDTDVAAYWGSSEAPVPWTVAVPEGADLVVLDGAPLELAGRVAMRGRLLYDDDPPLRVRWQSTTRKLYLDEVPRRDRLDRLFFARQAHG